MSDSTVDVNPTTVPVDGQVDKSEELLSIPDHKNDEKPNTEAMETENIISLNDTTTEQSIDDMDLAPDVANDTPTSSSSANNDSLFEPSLEMMVNDFDDERTLEEEEALAATESEDPNAELSSLQREGDMPIEELLALYNFVTPAPSLGSSSNSRSKRLSSRSRGSRRNKQTLEKEGTNEAALSHDDEHQEASNHEESTSEIENQNISEPAKEERVSLDENLTSEQTQSDEIKSERLSSNSAEEEKTINLVDDIEISINPPQQIETTHNTGDDLDDEDDEDEDEEESELRKLYPETYKNKDQRLLRTSSRPQSEEEDEEDDGDYSPGPDEDDYKKTIMVGSEYQAQIPEGLCRYDDALPYENEDKLVWDPSQLNENDIELYLQKASSSNINSNGSGDPGSSPTNSANNSSTLNVSQVPCGAHLRDDEQSLYLLLQCGHNTEEALRRRRLNASVPSAVAVAAATTATSGAPGCESTMSLWSEEECRNFESGLRIFGKDFHAIQQSKVRTRAVGELVQFYYLWKKTERHDVFANKARLEKKKYSLHPGLTDYMDRFLEEQENNGPNSNNAAGGSGSNGGSNGYLRDRSSSPGVNCLLYNDFKRQRSHNYTTSTLTSTVSNPTVTLPTNLSTKQSSMLNDPLALNDVEVLSSSYNRNNVHGNHNTK